MAQGVIPRSSYLHMARTVLKALASQLVRLFTSDGIKGFNMYGAEKFAQDVAALERFAARSAVPHLSEELAEPLQLCQLLLSKSVGGLRWSAGPTVAVCVWRGGLGVLGAVAGCVWAPGGAGIHGCSQLCCAVPFKPEEPAAASPSPLPPHHPALHPLLPHPSFTHPHPSCPADRGDPCA